MDGSKILAQLGHSDRFGHFQIALKVGSSGLSGLEPGDKVLAPDMEAVLGSKLGMGVVDCEAPSTSCN